MIHVFVIEKKTVKVTISFRNEPIAKENSGKLENITGWNIFFSEKWLIGYGFVCGPNMQMRCAHNYVCAQMKTLFSTRLIGN